MSKIKNVPRYAARLIEELRAIDYEIRPWVLHLFLMRYWRLRYGLTCSWRILRGNMGPELLAEFPLRSCDRTRGFLLTLLALNPTGLLLVYRPSNWKTSLWNCMLRKRTNRVISNADSESTLWGCGNPLTGRRSATENDSDGAYTRSILPVLY